MSHCTLLLVVIPIVKMLFAFGTPLQGGDHVPRSHRFSIICAIHDMISQILTLSDI
jgi:hypothetical protein